MSPARIQPPARIQSRRSFIFTPGTRPDMFPKALASGTDIVCVDLEDAVAPKDKAEARDKAFAYVPVIEGDPRVERMIRINCLRTPEGMADVKALIEAEHPAPAVMLPKVKGPEEVRNLADLLDDYQRPTRLHVIIETNEGLEAAVEIATSSDRIEALFFGGVDMAADLRCRNVWNALLYARSRVVHAAATAGVDVIDVPWLDLEDEAGMIREAEAAAELGFSGKGTIHPKQIPHINRVFTPDDATVAHARKVLDAFAAADSGLLVVDGKLIEKPVLRSMTRIVNTWEAAQRG
ncbi:CoA ester lyase [Tistrella mobilis]|uniref:HpcH/HpaI aldolase/citrate lyase family protein n=1 Tax=Tistrella mobilis TaxID=171437 RepID=UPI00355745B5